MNQLPIRLIFQALYLFSQMIMFLNIVYTFISSIVMFKIFGFIWIFIAIQNIEYVYSSCQAKTDIGNILQDSITLHFDKKRQKYNFQYPNVLFEKSVPKLALTINKYQIRNLTNIQYHIATIFTNTSIMFHMVIPLSSGVWKNFRLSFWVMGSSFNNLAIGYVILENIQNQSSKFLNHSLNDQPSITKVRGINQAVLFTTSFLSLVATSTKEFQIKIDAKIRKNTSQASQYYIQSSVLSGKYTKIRLIRFCYVLYTPSRLQTMKYHYYSLTQSLIPEIGTELNKYYRVLPQKLTIYPVLYGLNGVKAIKTTNLQFLSVDMKLSPGNIDILQFYYASKIENIQINSLILGQDMMMACISCPESYIRYTDPDIVCVSKDMCLDDEIPTTDQEGIQLSCRKCVGNSIIAKKGNNKYCQCSKGYASQPDGICKKTEVYKSLSQQCSGPNSMKDLQTNKCVCRQGYYLDHMGQCRGCEKNTSFWDLEQSSCACLPGYQKDESKNTCIIIGLPCGMNQIYMSGKCQCDEYAVKLQKDNKLQCIECSSGFYKLDGKNQCNQCNSSCRECINLQICLVCRNGYYFSDFACQSRCGDGNKVITQECDDGNLLNYDGCSDQCKIQQGFQCKQDPFNRSLCHKSVVNNVTKTPTTENISSQAKILTPKAGQLIQQNNITQISNKQVQIPQKVNEIQVKSSTDTNTSTITNSSTDIDKTSPELQKSNQSNTSPQIQNMTTPNKTLAQPEYKLSVSKNSPIHLSSGIIIQLSLKPQKRRTIQQLYSMIKIVVSDKRAQPSRIYLSQDRNKLQAIRVLMFYNNIMPVVDFTIKVWVKFTEQLTKSVTLYSRVFSKISKSITQVDENSYLE